jgi:UDP-N-acetylmuramate: L-alanyl-gamma-D-glutamyl-meso-diaminopimelate ligase
VHNRELADSLEQADLVWLFRPDAMGEDFDAALESLGKKLRVFRDYDELASDMSKRVLAGDQVVFMSNGGFGGARQTLADANRRPAAHAHLLTNAR